MSNVPDPNAIVPVEEDVLTVDDIAAMSEEEILKSMLFESHFKSELGLKCKCGLGTCNRFVGFIPDALCEKVLEDIEFKDEKDFETEVGSYCDCQAPHVYDLVLKDGELSTSIQEVEHNRKGVLKDHA